MSQELPNNSLSSSNASLGLPDINHFSLIDGSPIIDYKDIHDREEEEVELVRDETTAESDTSPQHQLFNNQAIIPLNTSDFPGSNQVIQQNQPQDNDNILDGHNIIKDKNYRADGDNNHHNSASSKSMLLAKFKESLKLKNSQIKVLKDSLSQVENFKLLSDELRRELDDLRASHESWTVSIAESKRSMHEEIEAKNSDIKSLKTEASCLQIRLNDSQSNIKQLKTRIQDLESRLVSTSAAHQKERESLSKELNASKSNAIKQLRKEHELNIERTKLEFEKSIEALKGEILSKDQQLIEDANQKQQLLERYQDLSRQISDSTQKYREKEAELIQLKQTHDEILEKLNSNQSSCDSYKNELEQLNRKVSKLTEDLTEANKKLELVSEVNEELEKEIDLIRSERQELTDRCQSLQNELEETKTRNENLSLSVKDCTSNSTEFEYLKNIVYQFMLGREPLVLARVISAVFKFDANQVDQVCKVQEAIQSATRHLAHLKE